MKAKVGIICRKSVQFHKAKVFPKSFYLHVRYNPNNDIKLSPQM